MHFIDVSNMKEITPCKSYFYVVQNFLKLGYVREKHEENRAFFTTNPICFKFDM